MELNRRTFLQGATVTSVLGVIGASAGTSLAQSSDRSSSTLDDSSLAFNAATWNYDATNDVYWQIGISYVSTPAAADYETLGVFVPGAYLTGTANSDGTYTATINDSGTVGGFTPGTAPIVLPVNTPGYSAQKPPTSYSYNNLSSYLASGFVYVHAGMRGKDSNTSSYTGNAPWGVTDLKAAVRYIRYNTKMIPGNKDRMVCFGHSGGGAQSAIMGASGDSALYTPYLESLGAAMTDANGRALSDAIAGAMCWCPITSLDYANAAYEWNMGQFTSTNTRAAGTWTEAYSKDLAGAFATHQNELGLTDASGRRLTLSQSATGVYLSGSYYDHVMSVITNSLNNYLSDTTFPTSSYSTAADYIAALNSSSTWVTYDSSTNTASVASLAGFAQSQKSASKSVGAFDGPSRSLTENIVFGSGSSGLHFAKVSRDVIAANESEYAALSGWDSSYAAAEYDSDFATTDSIGKDIAYRVDMYNPMYYLSNHYAGHGSARVAPHWRIRTGITQGDTASTVEINLALALKNSGISDVDFATVWGQGHTMAERTGNSTTNFIAWITENVAK